MEKNSENNRFRNSNAIFGILLLLSGIVFLFGELLDIHIGQFLWPFVVIGVGVGLFLLALGVEEKTGEALAIVSGIVSMVGLILLYQNITDHWASWSYAWALVAPTGPGLGHFLYGTAKGRSEMVKAGKDLMKVGLGIFLVAAVFFELVIGVSGWGISQYGWPMLLIVLGLFLLLRNLRTTWQH
jgi:hypothetical protein